MTCGLCLCLCANDEIFHYLKFDGIFTDKDRIELGRDEFHFSCPLRISFEPPCLHREIILTARESCYPFETNAIAVSGGECRYFCLIRLTISLCGTYSASLPVSIITIDLYIGLMLNFCNRKKCSHNQLV